MAELKSLEDDFDVQQQNILNIRDKIERTQCQLWDKQQQLEEWRRRLEQLEAVKLEVEQASAASGDLAAKRTEITRLQTQWRSLEVQQSSAAAALHKALETEDCLRYRGEACLAKVRSAPFDAAASCAMRREAVKRNITALTKEAKALEQQVQTVRAEAATVQEALGRKEKLYSSCVRQLQHAAVQLQQVVLLKEQRCVHLSAEHARARYLSALLSGSYKPLTAATKSAQSALQERLKSRQSAYLGVLTQLSTHHPQLTDQLALIYALLEPQQFF
ncbi:caspase recruitment domain-containing protein 9-like [Hyalella azteca]|uniref:Caspase recruitment domain-containing protein 9-like n=1 Tax=Hyalella azteca TaxID=294128 RepID=A0A979FIU0_HYAAZ|nr:caspase recruitment domain-containing protein 9-like [Hyalella azteca]